MSVMRVDVLGSARDLFAERSAWEALVASAGATTPFQAWATTYHAARMETAMASPMVLVARGSDGDALGIWPLGLRAFRRGPFRWNVLQTVGPTRLDFVDAIVAREHLDDVLTAFVGWLATNWSCWDELRLAPVREDAMLRRGLSEISLPSTIALESEAYAENLGIKISENAVGWEDVCSGETRRGTRRVLKKLEQEGFEFRRVSEGYELGPAVDALVTLHAKRRRELGDKSRLLGVDNQLLREFVVDALAEGGDLWILERDGAAVAVQWTLRLGDKMSHYRLAFDSTYRAWSPGIGLLAAAVDAAVKAKVKEYDFGFGVEEYKRRWANVRRDVFRVRLKNRNLGRAPRRLFSLAANMYRIIQGPERTG